MESYKIKPGFTVRVDREDGGHCVFMGGTTVRLSEDEARANVGNILTVDGAQVVFAEPDGHATTAQTAFAEEGALVVAPLLTMSGTPAQPSLDLPASPVAAPVASEVSAPAVTAAGATEEAPPPIPGE